MIAEEVVEGRDVGDERKEFHEQRASGIGATDSPKILGLSRWGTALTVYEDKVHPRTDDTDMSLPAWVGLRIQNVVAEMYSQKSGNRVRASNRHFRHPEHDWMVCHLDYRVAKRPEVLVECKTKAYMTGWGPDGSTEIPADVWIQVQHEMAVTAATEAHVAVLFGHHTFRTYPIPRDNSFIQKMIPQLSQFWFGNVIARIPPIPSGHDLDSEFVARRHPDHDASLRPATPEQHQLVERLLLARHNTKQMEAAQAELENQIKDIIGDAAGLRGSFGQITWKKSKPSVSVDWEQVAVTYGNVIEDLFLCVNPGEDDALVKRLARAESVYSTAVGLATVTKPGSRRFLVQEAK